MTQLISFLGGFFLAGALSYWAIIRFMRVHLADPLLYPPNNHVLRLVDAVKRQIHEWKRLDYRFQAEDPKTLHEAVRRLCECSDGSSVWIAKKGQLLLPDGSTLPIAHLAVSIEKTLEDAYRALDLAASVVLDYADRLPHGALEKEGQLLYSCKYAFENELHELARILGLDPQKNEVARFGGTELWRRQSERIFPAPFMKKQYAPSDAARFAEKALLNIAYLASSIPDRSPDSNQRALKAIDRLAVTAYKLPTLALQVGTGDPMATQKDLDIHCTEHDLVSDDLASYIRYA